MKLCCRNYLFVLAFFIASWSPHAPAQSLTNSIQIVEIQGAVEVAPAATKTWGAASLKQSLAPGDRLRTGPNSRVSLRWTEDSVVPFGASTELEILPPRNGQPGLQLYRGVLSFFHRDKPGSIRIVTRGASAGVEGTEFVLAVSEAGRSTMSVIDGKVSFGNEQGSLMLTNGQQAIADPGQAPMQTAGFIANNVLQWCFYYPAVLDPADLNLTSDEQSALAESLAAYKSGDLLGALARYPQGRQPGSDFERVYYAALLLSVGQVEETENVLSALPAGSDRPQQLAAALRTLIAAVKRAESPSTPDHQLATALLASSYYEQSRAIRRDSLERARELAREATVKSPQFGFAWTRLAELEFSFGRVKQAREALARGLELSPRNAQALALKGFLLTAENETAEAITWFDRALEVDSGLANAWLGRGLSRIRRGEVRSGRDDLLIAAALEPQRAELRSYLGKAHEAVGDYPHAEQELKLASQLDPNDPTPHLYSALIHQQNNRVNDAIRELEKSQQLNDNRSVYRSQLLLNQDHAVRSANLARIYADAGMTDLSVREASRAVTYDYANYSAHYFLANSYDAMRDPGRVNLRYGTPALAEYRIAELLAPVDAGPLSPTVSQSEYSRLFNRDHVGFFSDTSYLSRGFWAQSFAQYGTFETFNYSLEGHYRTDPGQRDNNDYEYKELSLSVKQQITPQDHVLLSVQGSRFEGGDTGQRYDPDVVRDYDAKEEQIPNLSLGYHHEWSPGVHTLVNLGRLVGESSSATPNTIGLVTASEGAGNLVGLSTFVKSLQFETEQELYSAEIQQILQTENHSSVFGALYQHLQFALRTFEQTADALWIQEFPSLRTVADQRVDVAHERFSVYGYHSWQVLDSLLLVGGVSFDNLVYPENWSASPVSSQRRRREQLSPKAGLVWTPTKDTSLRASYTRSLAGTGFDQSFRIEPTQVAGINQSYRSLIPESLKGTISGAAFDTYGIYLDQRFETATYVRVGGELLYSTADRKLGTHQFDFELGDEPVLSDFRLKEHLESRERTFVTGVDQLLGTEWAAGAAYRLTQAEVASHIGDSFANADPAAMQVPLHQNAESLLHHLNLHLNFNHASGFFSSFEAVWYRQENTEDLSSQPGDDFWHFNLVGGYRFWQRRARIEAGVLNLSDQDYRLHPIVYHNDLPRGRTVVARLQLSF